MNQLIILILITPLLLIPILMFLRSNKFTYPLVTLMAGFNFLLTILLSLHVYNQGPLLYELGNWNSPIGIRLNADYLSCLFLILIGFMNLVCLISCKDLVSQTIKSSHVYIFYIAWILCNTGFLGIILTDDIFNMFVFLEIASLSSYYLISQGNTKGSLVASIQYLFVGSIGAVFVLFSIGLLYMITGTLNMQDITKQLMISDSIEIILFAAIFLLVGVGIKSALFPLHGWLVKTYAFSPSIVTTYFAGTSTKIGIYIFFRIFLDILNNIKPLEIFSLTDVLISLSSIGVILITYYAIKQNDIRKMLAYSSVGQLGYIFIAMILYLPDGITASLVHTINHSVIKTGLFLTITLLFVNKNDVLISDLSGLSARQPLTATCLLILSFGLIGVPLTAGFVSKWYLISALVQSKYWIITIVVLITSFMTIFYVWKMVEQMYRDSENSQVIDRLSNHQLVGIYVLTFLTIFLGVETTFTVGIAQSIAYDIIYGVM